MKNLFTHILIFIFSATAVAQNGEKLLNDFPKGIYDVGFKVIETYDYSRTYQKNRLDNNEDSRPMQIAVWYPSRPGNNKLTLKKYIEISSRSTLLVKNKLTEKEALQDFLNAAHINKVEAERFINLHLNASMNALHLDDTFPLVIYAPGMSASWNDNFLLGEYLASKGYVVMASKSRGLNSIGMSATWSGVESQTRDMEFIRSEARKLPFVDFTKTNVIGRSWGAISALLYSIRNKNVNSITSLDGTLSYNAMTLMKDSEYPGGEYVYSPILLAVGKNRAKTATPIDKVNYYENVKYADAYQAEYTHMPHTAFGSYFLLYHYLLRKNFGETTASNLIDGYLKNIEHVAGFLNHYNTSQKKELWHLKSNESMQFYSKKAKSPLLLNYGDFGYQLDVYGVDSAINVYRETAKLDLSYANKELFNASYINAYAYKCLGRNNIDDALKLLELAVEVFPNNFNLFDSLGEIKLEKGLKKEALKAYEMSLKLNPKNENAKSMIYKLKNK